MSASSRALLTAVLAAAGLTALGARRLDAIGPVHSCGYCHVSHTALGTSLTSRRDSEVLCLSCHGPTGQAPSKAEVHANRPNGSPYPPFRFTCVDCHDPHESLPNWLGRHTHSDGTFGGTNISYVGLDLSPLGFARIDVPDKGPRDVVFESRGGRGAATLHSFADDDEDRNGVRDGICEVCHSKTKYATSTGGQPHHAGSECTTCHPHRKGFSQE